MKNTPKFIVIHGTDYSYRLMKDQFVACNQWHKDRNFPVSSLGLNIGYHDLFTNGVHYKCREATDEGAHCNQQENGFSMNFQSLGFCLGFDGDLEFPLPEDYLNLQQQVWKYQEIYNIPNENVRFHRYWAKNKTCPGSLITDQWLKDLLTRPQPIVPRTKGNDCLAEEAEVKSLKQQLQDIWKWIS